MAKQEIEVSNVFVTEKQSYRTKTKKKQFPLSTIIRGSLVPVLLVILWEILSRIGYFPAYQLPAPTTILATIYDMFVDRSLWGHVGLTTYRVLVGFVIGTLIAVLLGSF